MCVGNKNVLVCCIDVNHCCAPILIIFSPIKTQLMNLDCHFCARFIRDDFQLHMYMCIIDTFEDRINSETWKLYSLKLTFSSCLPLDYMYTPMDLVYQANAIWPQNRYLFYGNLWKALLTKLRSKNNCHALRWKEFLS